MPDYDPKSIPVLDDIIEHADDAADVHQKIIISDEINTDDNTLDMFSHATTEIEIEHSEPEIGAIDRFIEDDVAVSIETSGEPGEEALKKAPDHDEADNERLDESGSESPLYESALIDYSREDPAENDFETQTENNISSEETDADDEAVFNVHTLDEQSDQPADIIAPFIITDEAPPLDLDAIIDDVVTQLMPELEQQLRSRLKQALQEQLPQEIIEPTTSE